MRGLRPTLRTRYRTGLDGREPEGAAIVGRDTAESAKALVQALFLAVLRMRVLAEGVCLPNLDQAVVDRRTVAVEQAALHRDALARHAGGRDVSRGEPGQPDVQIRADGLTACGVETHV